MSYSGNTPNRIDLKSFDGRARLAKIIIRLFAKWELAKRDQLKLLGLNPSNKAMLIRLQRGCPLPCRRDILERAGLLLSIHKCLRVIFPNNSRLVYSWVTRRNKMFNSLTPLEVMLLEGKVGLTKISRYLNHEVHL